MSNTPILMQSEEQAAPWNQTEQTLREVDVTISETLSKTVTVEVPDIYDKFDLRDAVRDQILCPSDRCKDWDLDDFEVIEE